MKYKILFYKADCDRARWYDKLVAFFTRGPYSHVEIYCEKYDTTLRITPRDDSVYLVRKPKYNLEHWDIIDVELNDNIFADMVKYADMYNKYDYIGALSSAFKYISLCSRRKLFCSRGIAMLLDLKDSCKYSPNKLYKEILKNVDSR